MMLARPVLVLLLAIAIPGCTTLIQQTPGGAWVGVEPGGLLTLHQSVTVPSGRTRVWLVNGRLSATAASYRTACGLEVHDLSRARPRTIPAGSWRIRRIQNYWTEVVSAPAPEGIHFRLAGDGDSGDPGRKLAHPPHPELLDRGGLCTGSRGHPLSSRRGRRRWRYRLFDDPHGLSFLARTRRSSRPDAADLPRCARRSARGRSAEPD